MEKFKQIARKLLFPHKIIVAVLIIASTVGLVYVFTNGLEDQPIAYAVYPLSFYSLCTAIAPLPVIVTESKKRLYHNPYTARYITEQELRFRISLYNSTAFNFAFGIFKLIVGVLFRSVWFGAVGVYYMVLSLTRFLLVKKDRALPADQDENKLLHWQGYRLCGGFLLIVNAAMSAVVFLCIWQNQSYVYPGFLIYASAAYTFYRLTMAIIQNIKLRSHNQPLFLAAKITDLSAALMSIFTLQTAMFTTFGSDTEETLRQLMNSLTGGTVCFIVVCMAVYMLVRANKEIKASNK